MYSQPKRRKNAKTKSSEKNTYKSNKTKRMATKYVWKEMFIAPNYKIKMWNEDGLCEAVVNEAHTHTHSANKQHSLLLLLSDCVSISRCCCSASHFASWWIASGGKKFIHFFPFILFRAFLIFFLLLTIWHVFSLSLHWLCVCVCCVRLIIFDSIEAKWKEEEDMKNAAKTKTVEVQCK